jgi:ABC-2 type transport system ATP-binding protein
VPSSARELPEEVPFTHFRWYRTSLEVASLVCMLEFQDVTKRYGHKTAVADLSVTVAPGRVTGFLGPNGAGKSTCIRLLLGLDRPTSGRALIAGRLYRDHVQPLRLVGAHLDSRAVHPGRSARQHLLALARANALPARRADECLELVGLSQVARHRAGGFSLGMSQRLGIAAALLGDPQILLLDEPVNGLDTDGVEWIRGLLRRLADEGRTVLMSSHLLAEVEQSADHVVVLGRGRLLADSSICDLLSTSAGAVVLRTPDSSAAELLAAYLPRVVVEAQTEEPGALWIRGTAPREVGEAAHALGLRVHGLALERTRLEDAYRRLVDGSQEHTASPPRTVNFTGRNA